jgi:hypothetical protein
MGLREARASALAARAEHDQRDDNPERRWEYLARNLEKVPGVALENDFNSHGDRGWEFVAVADGYAIFKRPA